MKPAGTSARRRLLAVSLTALSLVPALAFVLVAGLISLWPVQDHVAATMDDGDWYREALVHLVPDVVVAALIAWGVYALNRRILAPAERELAMILAAVPAAVVLVPGVIAAVRFVVERPLF